MAEITQTRQLPAEFIEALGKTYADQLSRVAGTPIDTAAFAPRVAAQDPLQTQAAQLAASGVGSFQPFVTAAEQAATQAGTTLAGVPAAITAAQQGLTAAGTELTGAGTTLGGAQPFITQAAGLTGPTAFRDFLSPFQQDVIDTTLTEFDRQAAARQAQQSAAALGVPGAFGGGREGVLQAEFQAGSDRNRAALQAELLQKGFEQAQQLAGQDFTRRLGLAQAQSGLAVQQAALAQQRAGLASQQLGIGGAQQSLAQQQLGTGQFQTGLASLVPQLQRADISQLGTVGGAQQAFAQAQIDAANQAAREAAFEPLQRAGFFGTGVTGLMGGYPGQFQFTSQPSPSPLQTALGAGATFAGIYGGLRGFRR